MSSPKNNREDELVLTIPRASLETVGIFQGLKNVSKEDIKSLFESGETKFLRRGDCETDPTHKQIIPYCVLTHAGKIMAYERGAGGGEKGLASKLSIGIGGHVNPEDESDGFNLATYTNAVERELIEEITTDMKMVLSPSVGLINDDSNSVGEVHLGIVEVYELSTSKILPNEDAIHNPQFYTAEELKGMLAMLETWSQISLDFVVDILNSK